MHRPLPLVLSLLLAPTLVVGSAGGAWAQAGIRPVIPPGTGGAEQALRGVGVDETYETEIPLDATFRDHEGNEVTLGSLWRADRPSILQFVYYDCATTCDVALNGTASVLVQQPRTVGIDVDVYTISMNPHETVQAARDARGRILGRYGRAEAEQGWHFLVGDEAEIARVARAVGYRFRWDDASQQFVHPAVLMVLRAGAAPRVGRYLYGIEHAANDVRLGLAEAADGRTLDAVESALLYCFRYDAHEGRYVVVAWRIMRIGGGITAMVLLGALLTFWRRELRARRAQLAADAPTT